MYNANANDECECDKKIENIELVQECFQISECELRMRQNESLHAAIGPNTNILSDRKSPHLPHSLFTFALHTSGLLALGALIKHDAMILYFENGRT